MNPLVDTYFEKDLKWHNELTQLRRIVLECQLTETLKWGSPCYMYNNVNVLILGEFKAHCVISFFKGALLQEDSNLLQKPGENSQATRTIYFTSVEEILKEEKTLKSLIFQAIEVEKAGLKVELKKKDANELPAELEVIFDQDAVFKQAFFALTPGRQRAYLIHFSGAKQAQTRINRIEKCKPTILAGRGINDCTCGLSKKMPYCDGSHKALNR